MGRDLVPKLAAKVGVKHAAWDVTAPGYGGAGLLGGQQHCRPVASRVAHDRVGMYLPDRAPAPQTPIWIAAAEAVPLAAEAKDSIRVANSPARASTVAASAAAGLRPSTGSTPAVRSMEFTAACPPVLRHSPTDSRPGSTPSSPMRSFQGRNRLAESISASTSPTAAAASRNDARPLTHWTERVGHADRAAAIVNRRECGIHDSFGRSGSGRDRPGPSSALQRPRGSAMARNCMRSACPTLEDSRPNGPSIPRHRVGTTVKFRL